MTTDFPTAPSAYGLNGPSATVTVEKSILTSHTEILTTPVSKVPRGQSLRSWQAPVSSLSVTATETLLLGVCGPAYRAHTRPLLLTRLQAVRSPGEIEGRRRLAPLQALWFATGSHGQVVSYLLRGRLPSGRPARGWYPKAACVPSPRAWHPSARRVQRRPYRQRGCPGFYPRP